MNFYRKKTLFPVSAENLFNWHLKPVAFEALSLPWEKMTILRNDTPLKKGAEVHFKIHKGHFSLTWEAKITQFDPPFQFIDEQIRGPFKSWVHTHRVIPHGENEAYLEDIIVYENRFNLPKFITERMIDRLFTYRHERLSQLTKTPDFCDHGGDAP